MNFVHADSEGVVSLVASILFGSSTLLSPLFLSPEGRDSMKLSVLRSLTLCIVSACDSLNLVLT